MAKLKDVKVVDVYRAVMKTKGPRAGMVPSLVSQPIPFPTLSLLKPMVGEGQQVIADFSISIPYN